MISMQRTMLISKHFFHLKLTKWRMISAAQLGYGCRSPQHVAPMLQQLASNGAINIPPSNNINPASPLYLCVYRYRTTTRSEYVKQFAHRMRCAEQQRALINCEKYLVSVRTLQIQLKVNVPIYLDYEPLFTEQGIGSMFQSPFRL